MEKYSETKYNVIAVLIAAALVFVAVTTAEYENGTGMAKLYLMWLPVVTVVFTLAFFFTVKMIVPKVAWIPTLLGVGFLLLLAFSAFTG